MPDNRTQPLADSRAAELRGFGPVGILAIAAILLTGNIAVTRILIVPVGAVLVLVWAHWSRTPWRDLGFARPTSWLRTITVGIAIGVALKLVMKAVVMPLFGAGHYAIQGVAGVQQALIVGLVFGSLFAATRNLWLVITAHIAFDLTAYAIIYWNLETAVGQFFRLGT